MIWSVLDGPANWVRSPWAPLTGIPTGVALLDQIAAHLDWLWPVLAALIGWLTRYRWWPRCWTILEGLCRPYVTIARLTLATRDLRLERDRERRRAEAAEANTAAYQDAYEKALDGINVLMQGAQAVQAARMAGLLVTLPESSNAPASSPSSSPDSPPTRAGPMDLTGR